jgi:hypothetical protein
VVKDASKPRRGSSRSRDFQQISSFR